MNKDNWAQPVFRALDGKYYDTQEKAEEASKKQYSYARFSELLRLSRSSITYSEEDQAHAEWLFENAEQILEAYNQAVNAPRE